MVKRRKKGITKKDTGKGFNERSQKDKGRVESRPLLLKSRIVKNIEIPAWRICASTRDNASQEHTGGPSK